LTVWSKEVLPLDPQVAHTDELPVDLTLQGVSELDGRACFNVLLSLLGGQAGQTGVGEGVLDLEDAGAVGKLAVEEVHHGVTETRRQHTAATRDAGGLGPYRSDLGDEAFGDRRPKRFQIW
jgi:hypothetical protein